MAFISGKTRRKEEIILYMFDGLNPAMYSVDMLPVIGITVIKNYNKNSTFS